MSAPNDELPDVPALRTLEPPPNGLVVLRERLDASERRRWWLIAVPATVALAAALLFFLVPRGEQPAVSVEPGVAIAPPPPPARPPRPLADPAAGADVTFYWVSSASRAPDVPAAQPTWVSIDEAPHVSSTTIRP